MTENTNPTPTPQSPASSHRHGPNHLWWPIGVVGLTAMVLLLIAFLPAVDSGLKFPFGAMLVMLASLLLLLWLIAASGLDWRLRLGIPVGLVSSILVLRTIVRVDGFDGNMLPQFVSARVPAPDSRLPERVTSADESIAVDLIPTGPHDFPRFLGPDGTGSIRAEELVLDPPTVPRLLWKQAIGAGWSAFAVVGDFAVTQEQQGQEEVVSCYRLRDGRLAWSHRDPGRFSEWMGGDGPRATPTIADGDVYVMTAQGLLHRLDGTTGRPRWTRDILKEHKATNLQWAKSNSPTLVAGLVIVTLGESPVRPSLAAYRQSDGKLVWTAGEAKASYATPVVANLAGREQLVVVTANTVDGHDPLTGEKLWTKSFPGNMAKCSNPIVLSGDRVFASAGYGTGCFLMRVTATPQAGFSAEELWSAPRNLKTRFTNVVVHGEFAYGLDDGILQCVDLASGKAKWKGGRYGHGQVLCVNDVLLVQTEKGDIALVAADPAGHRELLRFQAIDGKTWNNPVITGRRLLVRNAQEAACYEWTEENPPVKTD